MLAYLRETQVYGYAAFEGKTLFGLPPHLAEQGLEQWAYLLAWLEQSRPCQPAPGDGRYDKC